MTRFTVHLTIAYLFSITEQNYLIQLKARKISCAVMSVTWFLDSYILIKKILLFTLNNKFD